ncbi:hypothetical protein [Paenibacillus taiwanensis]|uniref:hypothetical protein n=1 Tax=Paenibacillus taiwanensis TaxID=401638 RepID=UPI0004233CE7|nr:hypothetical protein [Paenibacillus taiwanensis]
MDVNPHRSGPPRTVESIIQMRMQALSSLFQRMNDPMAGLSREAVKGHIVEKDKFK